MKATDTPRKATKPVLAPRQHRAGQYNKVFDARKRRVRGLWERNGTYYAQAAIPDPTGKKVVRRVRLEDKEGNPVGTVAEAVAGLAKLKVRREDETLTLTPKRTPTLAEYGETYLEHAEAAKEKRPLTIRRERVSLAAMRPIIGDRRLRAITVEVVKEYMAQRRKAGVSLRCVNIELQALRNILHAAVVDKHIASVPEFKRFKEPKTKRRMLTREEIMAVADAAVAEAPKTGVMVRDFILLMAYSGGRWAETLRLRWADVDFTRGQLNIGTDGLSKNGLSRAVNFNQELRSHLEDMATRKAPDSDFLFPSPRTKAGAVDVTHAMTFNKTLRDARVKAGVPDFTCHMCRHHFASMCLMSKVDVGTVAEWLGHQDGGILLTRAYSHLLDEHKVRQAALVKFGPSIATDGAAPQEKAAQ